MPTQKDLKRLVRRRMQKTGESYTAARAQLIKNGRPSSTRAPLASVRRSAARSSSTATRTDYAKLAGMSDASIKAATGCTWKRWVDALDYVHAHEWPHRKIAAYVQDEFKVRDWWAQGVATGYERIRGLREIGQRRGGSFEASKSRTFPVPVAALYKAFAVARVRARWLPGVKLVVRKAVSNKSVRMTWEDGTSVDIWLIAKDKSRSTAQVQHRKLPSKESMTRAKAFWTERLDSLGELLAP